MKPGTAKPAPHDDASDAGYAAGQVIGVVLLLLCGFAIVAMPILVVLWVRGGPARKARREAEERAREEARIRAHQQAEWALRADYEQLAAKYGADAARRILNREIWVGAPLEAVLRARGQPVDVEEKIYKTKTKHVLKYAQTGKNRYALRYFVENGIVAGWEDKT